MSDQYKTIDFSPLFQHKVLTRVYGVPDFDSIKTLEDELKANASSVQTELGGGQFGHLGLVVSPTQYANASQVPYDRPAQPVLEIPQGTAQHEVARLRHDYVQAHVQFREVCDLEKQLLSQLTQAIDGLYIRALRNQHTGTIKQTIPQVFTWLYTKYGQVKQEALVKKAQSIREITYDIQDPMVVLWNEIDDLTRLAEAANNPYTPRQILEFGETALLKCSDFEGDMKKWYSKPLDEQTWANFKLFCDTAREAIIKVRGTHQRLTEYQSANLTVSKVLEAVETLDHKLNSTIALYQEGFTPPPQLQSANSSTGSSSSMTSEPSTLIMMELLQLMRDMRQDRSRQTEIGGNRPGNRRDRKNISKYCWSHGACTHAGSDCQRKKIGHQDAASFTSQMKGSTAFVKEAQAKGYF